jgi:hypothetical protein
LRVVALVAAFASWVFGAQAFDDRALGGADETVRYVPLPAQVTRDKVFDPDEELRERLHRWTLLALSD